MLISPASLWAWFTTSPPSESLVSNTIEEAIHARIAASIGLSSLVQDRHTTGAALKPASGLTVVPYLVLDYLGTLDTIRTTGRREVNTHLYQVTCVGKSSLEARSVVPLWKREFNPWMSPLLVRDAQIVTVRIVDRHDAEAGSVGPDGRPRFQTVVRFVVQANEPAAP